MALSQYEASLIAMKAFYACLEDTPAPVTDDGGGVPKVLKGVSVIAPTPGKPDTPEPDDEYLPKMSTVGFVLRGVKEKTLITKNRKPWAIAEPVPKDKKEGEQNFSSGDVCCGNRSTGCGGSHSSS